MLEVGLWGLISLQELLERFAVGQVQTATTGQ
jgi:hypothetical protein